MKYYYKSDLPSYQDRSQGTDTREYFSKMKLHGIHGKDYVIDKETHTANRLVGLGFVMEVTGLKRGQITQMIGKGKFPRSILINSTAKRWNEMEIYKWIKENQEK